MLSNKLCEIGLATISGGFGPQCTIEGLMISDAAVQFGPVQRTLCLNLGPDRWFGSSRLLNLGLDLEGPVQQVRFG